MRMQRFTKVLSLVVLVMMEVMTSFSHAITSQVSVTFNSNGWSEMEWIDVEYGQKIEAPADPIRDGYEFKWWAVEESNYIVRYLDKDTDELILPDIVKREVPVWATVVEKVTPIDGYFVVGEDSKSIVIDRDESQNIITFYYSMPHYKVTYVVNPALGYGMPEDFEVPTDLHLYVPWEMVDVKPQLTTEVDYAYNSEGEKVKGTWEFVTWDKDDFSITEDTTVTGGWVFTPATVQTQTYKYIVHYMLLDGTPVANNWYWAVDNLGDEVTVPAIPIGSWLYAKYRSPKKYQIVSGYESVTEIIDKDGYEIYIYYEEIPRTAAVNPNSVVTSGIKEEEKEVIEEEKAEIVEADEKEEIVEEEEKEIVEEDEKEEIVFFGMVWNQIWELLWDPEGNYRYWDFENDKFYYDTKLIAVWEPITYTISYEWVDGLENSNPTEYTVETEAFDLIPLEKSWYTFEGWYTSEWNKVSQVAEWSTWNLVLTAKRTQNWPRYSGGWSRSSSKKDTTNSDKESKNTHNSADEKPVESVENEVVEPEVKTEVENKWDADIAEETEIWNTSEMVQAYKFAYEHGITTKETFEESDTEELLNRKELAKILSLFAVNVMWMEPEEWKAGSESFNDTKRENSEMKWYMKSACELWLMWLESDWITVANHFDPNKSVTRAEFGTTLSRLLYGWVNNLHDDLDRRNNEWYEKHLRALKDNKIMTQVEWEWVKKIEIRWYVMLMLMRSANN